MTKETKEDLVKTVQGKLIAFYAISSLMGIIDRPSKDASKEEREESGRKHVAELEEQATEMAEKIIALVKDSLATDEIPEAA